MTHEEAIIEVEALIKTGYITNRQKEALVILLEDSDLAQALRRLIKEWKGETE